MSSRVDWKAVTDIVANNFPSYIPVPSLGDVENYKLLTFLLLKEQNHDRSPLTQSVQFYPIGENVFKSKSKKKSDEKPEILSTKLCNFDESESKSSTTVTATVSKYFRGEAGQSSVSPPISLGTITQLTVDYGVLNAWLKKRLFDTNIIEDAKKGNLLIIHEVITAEKLAVADQNEETEYSGGVCTSVGEIKGKYGWSRSTSNLSRPEDFGEFPIGYKVGKLRARRQVNPGKGTCKGRKSSDFLKLEPHRYFNLPYTERDFYETTQSENDEQDSDEETRKPHHKLSCFK